MRTYQKSVILLVFLIVIIVLILILARQSFAKENHPRHEVVVFEKKYRNRNFLVVRLPHCEHLEMIVAYNPEAETKRQAKERTGGIAVSTGPFYNMTTKTPVDRVMKNGKSLSHDVADRTVLVVLPSGKLKLTRDFEMVKNIDEAAALGQTLIPFSYDGFSKKFANQKTARNAIGITKEHIYIVQTTSDLWRLSSFMEKELDCQSAINCDGGHTVKGKSPFHLVFRWKNLPKNGA